MQPHFEENLKTIIDGIFSQNLQKLQNRLLNNPNKIEIIDTYTLKRDEVVEIILNKVKEDPNVSTEVIYDIIFNIFK